jgi:hypothetical protein
MRSIPRVRIVLFLCFLLAACGSDDDVALTAADCEAAAGEAVLTCIEEVGAANAACAATDGATCPADDAAVALAVSAAGDEIRANCSDDTVRAAGYGALMDTDALALRIESSCLDETASLAARSFGGPHGAAWAAATNEQRDCLADAHNIGLSLVADVAAAHRDCLAVDCDRTGLATAVAALRDGAVTAIAGECDDLASLVAIGPEVFADRAAAQADCATATAQPGAAGLELACGPRPDIARPPRGEYVQVVLDSDVWGTRCGDGSPFAFQLRLAPDGAPVENLLIAMEGGGVCLFEADCSTRPADLFEAMDDPAPDTGIMSNDPEVSPFADWSKAYLPYCNQDVFIGGGATNVFSNGFTVHRFGAINVRAALRYIRDAIWRELDENTAEGYRADRMRVFFGGFSAGAFGTLYNYHYVLDDLQWAHTTAFPDAGLALNSGGALNVGSLGAILIPESDVGWSSLPYLPPYCIDTDCGVGPIGLAASLPRLKAVPEQQVLILTNQIDSTQVGTTFFDSTADWVNELRFQYCEFKDADGVKHYMPAIPQSRHVISPFPDLFRDNLVDGVEMADWLWGAVTNPDAVVNRVEEGTLVEAYPGVERFPCEVAP